jgi:hypothetical protein
MRCHPRSRLKVEPLVVQFRAAKRMLVVGPAGKSSGTRVCSVYDVFDFDGNDSEDRDVSMASRASTATEYSLHT